MRVEIIYCPACQHKLRIPGDLMGQPVQCPSCQTEFIAPPPPEGERAGEAITARRPDEARASRDLPDDGYAGDRRHRDNKSNLFVTMAAIALIGVGALSLAVNTYKVMLSPQEIQDMAKSMEKMFPALPAQDQQAAPRNFLIGTIVFGVFAMISLLGGIAMLFRRVFPVAVIGSVLAIINISECCCLLGAPVGIACLVLLFQPPVRASFHLTSGPPNRLD